MRKALHRMYEQEIEEHFSHLTDRGGISRLNTTQRDFAWDGFHFYDFIEDGTLDARKVNRTVNFDNIMGYTINGKKYYIVPGELFRNLVLREYGKISRQC